MWRVRGAPITATLVEISYTQRPGSVRLRNTDAYKDQHILWVVVSHHSVRVKYLQNY